MIVLVSRALTMPGTIASRQPGMAHGGIDFARKTPGSVPVEK
jgi:hypothetical protein